MSTPDSRLAAYQATRERLDARRRTTRVRCIAPNRVCGNRCIPPEWSCRLKGEGNDPHLKAVGRGSDPVAGLANIERGLGRLGKGAFKLSFSEIEGGRKAIARGTAKLAPGDLKRKEEIKKRTDEFLGKVLLPASAIVGVGLLHRGLRNFKGYREGPGRRVDDATREAINLIRTNIPGYGARVRQRQQAGPSAVRAMARAERTFRTQGPEGVSADAGQRRTLTTMVQGQGQLDAELTTALSNSLRSVDGSPNNRRRPSGLDYTEWHARSLQAFWNTPRTQKLTPTGVDTGGSVFSIHATNSLLADSFGFARPSGNALREEGNVIVGRLSSYLRTTGESIRTSMRESGLNPKDPEAVSAFIGRSGGTTDAERLSHRTLTSAVLNTNYETQAKSLYARTVSSYDQLFKRVSEDLAQAPSIDVVRNRNSAPERERLRNLRTESFYNDAVQAHSSYLNRQLNLPEPVYGSYTATVARRAYHARFVAGTRAQPNNNGIRLTLTSTEAYNAGIEIARARGIPEPTNAAAALRLVNEAYGWPIGEYQRGNALGEITLVRGSSRPRGTPTETPTPATPRTERPARRRRQRSVTELTRIYERAGYTPEAARERAEREFVERRLRDNRADAYQLVRTDFTPTTERQGKPCGKSFVPKQAKCSKPTTARYANKPQEATSGNNTIDLLGKTALTAGVVAGGVFGAKKAYANRRKIALEFQKRNPEAFKQASAVYQRARQVAKAKAPEISNQIISRLSSRDVERGLSSLPTQFQQSARDLVGAAKYGTAYASLTLEGYKMTSVNKKMNYSTFKDADGNLRSIGSISNNLLTFNSVKSPNSSSVQLADGRKVDLFGVQFTVDESMRRVERSKETNAEIATKTKAMWEEHVKRTPEDALMYAVPFGDDGRAGGRTAAYQRMGFTKLPGLDKVQPWDSFNGNVVFALKSQGKVQKMNDDYKHYISNVLATADGSRFSGNRISREAATAKPYKPPKTLTNTGIKPVVEAPIIPRNKREEWSELPKHEYLDERHRERSYDVIRTAKAIESDQLADQFARARTQKGVIPENVDKLANFVRKNKVSITHDVFDVAAEASKKTGTATDYWTAKQADIQGGYKFSGMYFQNNSEFGEIRNKLYVSPKRKNLDNWADASQDAVRTVNEFMDNVANHNVVTTQNKGPKSKEAFLYNTTYNTAVNGDAHDLLVATHETGHAMHEKMGFQKIDISDKVEKELIKVTSAYGLSDVGSSQKELFAELFVLYTYSGERLRKEAPSVYAWIDGIASNA